MLSGFVSFLCGFEFRTRVPSRLSVTGVLLTLVSSLELQEEEREMKYRRYYQRVLKDRLTALRKVRYAVYCYTQRWCRSGARNESTYLMVFPPPAPMWRRMVRAKICR